MRVTSLESCVYLISCLVAYLVTYSSTVACTRPDEYACTKLGVFYLNASNGSGAANESAGSCKVLPKLPEEELLVPDLIRYWKYPSESHEVKTDDGYYLTLHRIPRGRKNTCTGASSRPVVFLQHGLLASSADWIENFPENSLGFMLADEGFDVWMGNVRGNTYSSSKHENYSTDSGSYWDFSFHEMGKFDLPAMISYVLQKTDQKQLYYVGHSQGTMMIFAGLDGNKVLQERIKTVFALAPVTRLAHVYSPIKYLVTFEDIFAAVLKVFRFKCFLPSSEAIKEIGEFICSEQEFCTTLISMLAGYDTDDFNKTRLAVYFSHSPAGTSIQNIDHFAQLIRSQVFRQYDHGYLGNLWYYKSIWPPEYRLDNIYTPMQLIYGSNDWLASPQDVKWTATQLPRVENLEEVEGFNHLDFLWGLSARRKVYDGIIQTIKTKEKL